MGIDYPDQRVLDTFKSEYDTAIKYDWWEEAEEIKKQQSRYLAQFNVVKLIKRLEDLTEKDDITPGIASPSKFYTLNQLRCLSKPLPFDIKHKFYRHHWTKKAYKSNSSYLTATDIMRMFDDAAKEGIGSFDPETNSFIPLHLINTDWDWLRVKEILEIKPGQSC